MGANKDPRYRTAKWQATRRTILHRDQHRCQMTEGCTNPADFAHQLRELVN